MIISSVLLLSGLGHQSNCYKLIFFDVFVRGLTGPEEINECLLSECSRGITALVVRRHQRSFSSLPSPAGS